MVGVDQWSSGPTKADNNWSGSSTIAILKMDEENDVLLFVYLAEGRYVGDLTCNQKRVIRKKSKKFILQNGELGIMEALWSVTDVFFS